MIEVESLKELYDKDFLEWLEENIKLIQEKQFSEVDWENIIEELISMGRNEIRSVVSFLAIILEHMYKWDHFRDLKCMDYQNSGVGWKRSIKNARKGILREFKRMPSLKKRAPGYLEDAWFIATDRLINWLEQNKIDSKEIEKIPEDCPYTYDEAMNRAV